MGSERLVLYTGKGGVGKTTTAAATALCAAERGARTLVVSADSAHSLGDVLGVQLGPVPIRITPGGALDAVEVDARVEMARHWGRIRDYLVKLFRYQGIEEVVAEELALLPGAEELTTLLAVEHWIDSGAYDFVVMDCAPTDTTLRLVTLPEVSHGALRLLLKVQEALAAVVTPLARGVIPVPLPDAGVFRDAEGLLYRGFRRLHRRITGGTTHVRMVLTPERMVLEEGSRAYTDLCLFDVPCDAVVMNRLLPDAAGDEEFFQEWIRVQGERREEVAERFAPLPVLEAPLQDDEVIGLERLSAHGRALFDGVDPWDVLCKAPRVRFGRRGKLYTARLPLPGVEASGLDVAKVEDELVVRAGGRRRALKLPRRMASLSLHGARLDRDELVVTLAPVDLGVESA